MPGPRAPRGAGFPTRTSRTRGHSQESRGERGGEERPLLPPTRGQGARPANAVLTQKRGPAEPASALHLQSPGVSLAFNTFFI